MSKRMYGLLVTTNLWMISMMVAGVEDLPLAHNSLFSPSSPVAPSLIDIGFFIYFSTTAPNFCVCIFLPQAEQIIECASGTPAHHPTPVCWEWRATSHTSMHKNKIIPVQ